MNPKTEEYLALAQRTANGLTRYWESWTAYLTTAARLYKYSFPDQLMIYAQRPDATACASYDIWNDRMNRYVRRGSKGIALLDESGSYPRLHYVFDVSDTGVRRNSCDPEQWELNDELLPTVSEMLTAEYGIRHERISQQFVNITEKLTDAYWDNNSRDILGIVDGSFFDDYDEGGKELQFKRAVAISITYTLLERCGFEPEGYFDQEDFQAIHTFSTPSAVYALGAAVSDLSREVLRKIERTVKTTTRRHNAKRSQYEYEQQERDLLDHRGLPVSRPDPQPIPAAADQVRTDAPGVSEAAAPGAVQRDAAERDALPAPAGSADHSREADGTDDGRTTESKPGPQQGAEPDGLGAAHEQPESAGRGSDSDGTDLQLSFFDASIPTEAEQIEAIDQAESVEAPSAFVLSQAEIENELRRSGTGMAGGKQRILALYKTQPDRKLRAKALAKEYGVGGHSHTFLDGSGGFVNHSGKGLEFDHYPEHQKTALNWAQVERYIDLMIQSDRYLTEEEKAQQNVIQDAHTAAEDAELERALQLISDFCEEEYYSVPTFPDLSKIGLAYTTVTDEEIPLQVNVDLVQYRMERYLDDVLVDERQYNDLSEFIEVELECLNFDRLTEASTDEVEVWRQSKAEQRSAETPAQEEADPEQSGDVAAPKKARDYRVGDTIRLDGKDFTVEKVGTLDVQLRDPDAAYPIFRAESKENLERLLQRPGNIHLHNLVVDLTAAQPSIEEKLTEEKESISAQNFRITDDHLGEGGPKQKYARNIEAIKTLFAVEQENRSATAEEQAVLSQYVGWGGMADAFDSGKENWAKEYVELKGLLSDEEYAAARASTLNAHYTSPTVIRAIYEAVGNMGFESGNILEPSMGVGNFFGMLPERMQNSRLYGVELDSITGRIAQKLYPEANITVAGFETTDRRDFYDLAVGNVPFGNYKVNDKAYNKLGFSIHNYFFAKAIDQVRPGGIVAFVTSRYTLDSKDSTARRHIAERADLLGAIRLPNNAFKANAGTEVVSDIL